MLHSSRPYQFLPDARSLAAREHPTAPDPLFVRQPRADPKLQPEAGAPADWAPPSPSIAGSKLAYFGVFDGHNGSEVSDTSSVRMLSCFREQLASQEVEPEDLDVPAALRMAFEITDGELLNLSRENGWESGSTAVVCVLSSTQLFVANLGDSRAVMSVRGKALDLSQDQNFAPSNGDFAAQERRRVEEAGGFVDAAGYLNGVLGVSRGLGSLDPLNRAHKLRGLSAVPVIRQYARQHGEEEFIIMACDGLWDVMSTQGAVEYVVGALRRHDGNVKLAAKALVKEALDLKTTDNVTVLLIVFSAAGEFWAPAPQAADPAGAQAAARRDTGREDNDGDVRPSSGRPRFKFSSAGLAMLRQALDETSGSGT